MELKVLTTREQAKNIISFFYSGKAFTWTLPEKQKDSIKERVNNALKNIHECRYWFTEDNKKVVAAGAIEKDNESNNGYFIGWLGVHEAYRRKGLARRIITEIENYVGHKNGTFIIVDTADNNLEANAFYSSLGYVKVGLIPHYYKKGVGKITYFKQVSPM